MKSVKYQLKNGLKVLLLESHKSPVVSVQMWVKNGSADEKKGEEGLSHFIEHLVFKGSRKYKAGEIAQVVEGSGGELNAYTTFDQTVFYVTISKEFQDVALDVISEMMGHPIFDKTEVDNEREVVIEEIKMGMDSPGRKASQLLFSTCFKNHPYGTPVIGYDKIIRKTSLKKIKDFFAERYATSNMLLVVSGDFQSSEMKKSVNKYFNDFKKSVAKKRSRKKEPKQSSPRLKVEQTEFQQTTVYFAWKAPNIKHKDTVALDVLSFILGQGDSSRLMQKLRMEKPLTNSVGAWTFAPQDDGVLAVSMGLDKENLTEAFSTLNSSLADFLTKIPTNDEMQKTITNFASDQVYAVETVDGIARKAGSLEFFLGDYKYFAQYMKQVHQLKPIDIVKMARKYFNPKTLSIVVMTNEKKTVTEKICKSFIKEYTKSYKKACAIKVVDKKFKPQKFVIATSSKKNEESVTKKQLKSGIRLYTKATYEIPTVSVRIGFHGGARGEEQNILGLSELFSRVWLGGTDTCSEEALNHKIDSLAAGLTTFSGRNTFGMSSDFLSNHQGEMFEILADVLLNPLFDDNVLDRERAVQVNQIKSRNDSPSQLCGMQFIQTMFPQHPNGKDMLGSEESLKKMSRKDLQSYYKKLFSTQNIYISIVGAFDDSEVQKFLNTLEKNMPHTKVDLGQFPLKALEKKQVLFKEMKKEQSHVVVGYRGLKMTDKDRYVLQIIQSILSGQGGRLFIELRDKNSLAYSVSPMKMEGIDGGYFGGYIACSPEKVDKAIEMLRIEFRKLVDQPVPAEELERAQKYLIGRHDIDLQKGSAQSNMILFDEIYGLNCEDSFHVKKFYQAVTSQDIQRVCAHIFNGTEIISVVGSQASTV